ncbi:M17 family metallopeptidase [Gluconobacter albidus]|uniref:Leucyl aminopeptidase n=1 Tax=Gluconobacter albidus TaxID=318683 RepID=A0AAW3QVN7_9PROT|nr:leucyl aminopeptidase family protein [Gluconobacter albidus]KXV37525.1 leucyl aminopeptidase [Gluconobacter albidus]GBQ92166.1 leucyl aminopeptidase [Gluconobacter albidus NBRC 3250]GLQ68222.1 leucyl aminopeptidase [Gluconobacter albidus]
MNPHSQLPFVTSAEAPSARLVHLVACEDQAAVMTLLGEHAAFLQEQGFSAKDGAFTLLPDEGGVGAALLCVASVRSNDPDAFGILGTALPEGDWTVVLHGLEALALESALLGFCMGAYRFGLGEAKPRATRMVVPDDATRLVALSKAVWFGRDLINMPANLLGPRELAEMAGKALVHRGASVSLLEGDDLRRAYPCLAEVGEGSERKPVVAVARWKAREGAPRISLIGKGVCFDTGGYDLKGAAGMLRMKKDMGGAALMLAVMCAAIDVGLDVDLELRLGCVENSVSGHAMRPGDVLKTRSGKTVEIGNTDAEGRLVLCDLITEASENRPDVILDAATLTGAARVALGPDVPALFSNDDELASLILESGKTMADVMWRMPLWHGYDAWLDSKIADFGNVTSKPMAGAITAALYLQKFVPEGQKWAHIDTYAWNDGGRPGRPEGGEVLGLRAILETLSRIHNNS